MNDKENKTKIKTKIKTKNKNKTKTAVLWAVHDGRLEARPTFGVFVILYYRYLMRLLKGQQASF